MKSSILILIGGALSIVSFGAAGADVPGDAPLAEPWNDHTCEPCSDPTLDYRRYRNAAFNRFASSGWAMLNRWYNYRVRGSAWDRAGGNSLVEFVTIGFRLATQPDDPVDEMRSIDRYQVEYRLERADGTTDEGFLSGASSPATGTRMMPYEEGDASLEKDGVAHSGRLSAGPGFVTVN